MSIRPLVADTENTLRPNVKPQYTETNRSALREISNKAGLAAHGRRELREVQEAREPASEDTIEDEEMGEAEEEAEEAEEPDAQLASQLASQMVNSTTNPHALFPVFTARSAAILRECEQIAQETPGIMDEEDEDTYDISMAIEYSESIFAYMRQLEIKMRPDHSYMDRQQELKWNMRSILMDWIVEVHLRFNLLPETLFLTVNYIDRFLSKKTVSLGRLQLVGIVALFLAAKYEEINCPSIQELVYMVDSGYSAEDILRAERYMIDILEFNLGYPGPMSFLRRTSKADDYDLETRTLAKYLLEITIMDQRFVAAPASWTAAAAHYLAREMLKRGPWTPLHTFFSGYTEEQLVPIASVLKECCGKQLEHHRSIFEKYSDRRFKRAAEFVRQWVAAQ